MFVRLLHQADYIDSWCMDFFVLEHEIFRGATISRQFLDRNTLFFKQLISASQRSRVHHNLIVDEQLIIKVDGQHRARRDKKSLLKMYLDLYWLFVFSYRCESSMSEEEISNRQVLNQTRSFYRSSRPKNKNGISHN